MQKAKLLIFFILLILLFGGVIMLMFSCKPLKPNGITIIPETANVYEIQYIIVLYKDSTNPTIIYNKEIDNAAMDFASGKVPFGICYPSISDK